MTTRIAIGLFADQLDIGKALAERFPEICHFNKATAVFTVDDAEADNLVFAVEITFECPISTGFRWVNISTEAKVEAIEVEFKIIK